MVVGVPGPVGHRVAVQWPGDCQNGNGHVLTRIHLLLDVAASVILLNNELVPVMNFQFKTSRSNTHYQLFRPGLINRPA